MFNRKRERRRRMAMIGLGVGLALLRGKRGLRRYAMRQILAGGFGPGSWGRFGGYGSHGHMDFSQMPLPPFIEARLKSWHEQAHGTAPSGAGQATPVRTV
jgi:hypothetical protein